jgi:methanogenic corrinoid protein MtbC1
VQLSEELDRLLALNPNPRQFLYQVALPMMRATGSRWAEGSYRVSQEHLVTTAVSALLGNLLRTCYVENSRLNTIVFATPSEEKHTLGTLAAAIFAAYSGFSFVYLGAEVPAEEILWATRRAAAQIVVLGVYQSWPMSRVGELRELSFNLRGRASLYVGGPVAGVLSAAVRNANALPTFHDFEALLNDSLNLADRTRNRRGQPGPPRPLLGRATSEWPPESDD